jgi:phage terminase large subunit-like protein
MEAFLGQPCVKGLDLASQEDLAADITVFQKEIEDPNTLVTKMHYYLFTKAYVPESTVAKPTNQHYQKWVHDGHLISTPGNEIDFPTIKLNILADISEYDVKCLGFDKHQGTLLRQELVDETGIEGVEIAQNPPTLSVPMKWLSAMISAGRVHHDGNPVMTWCISNVVAREDANENVFPRKEREESKIDCVTALLDALSVIKHALGEETSTFYEYSGF